MDKEFWSGIKPHYQHPMGKDDNAPPEYACVLLLCTVLFCSRWIWFQPICLIYLKLNNKCESNSFFLWMFGQHAGGNISSLSSVPLISSYDESWARYNLMEPIPLQVKHAAVEFIIEPFCPSGPCLRTMKISAQWCCVYTSYFTHNWETHGGQERLIPSHTGLKDLPTALTLHCHMPYLTLGPFSLLFFFAANYKLMYICGMYLIKCGLEWWAELLLFWSRRTVKKKND